MSKTSSIESWPGIHVKMSDDEEEEEYDVFAISKPAVGKNKTPSSSKSTRSSQTSRFGAVDENVNLEIKDDGDEGGATRNGESSPAGSHTGSSPTPRVDDESEKTSEDFEEGAIADSSSSELAEVADRLITEAGYRLCVYGIKNVKFVLAVGLGLFYAGIQVAFTPLLVPDIARDLCLQDSQTGWLRIIILFGTAFGALLQGCISDLTARRCCLCASLITAGLFGVIAAVLAKSHGGLLLCLILNGFGIGGILAIALPYYTELLPREGCERQISSLMVFIITGAAFISLISSEFSNSIPQLCAGYCFANWRITCLIFSILPLTSALLIYLLQIPESPRLLMERGEWTKAIEVLTKIYTDSHSGDDGEAFKYKANDLYRLGRQKRRSKPAPAPSTFLQRVSATVSSFFSNITSILRKPIGLYTDRLIVCACMFAFGYCGWALWLPDYIKAAEITAHRLPTANISQTIFSDVNYTTTMANTQFQNVTFNNVKFYDLFLSDVYFYNAVFQNCKFDRVVSEGVRFSNCRIVSSDFDDVDFGPRLFYNSQWMGSSFNKRSRMCSSDEPFAPTMAYYKIFMAHIGGIIGVFLASFLMSIIGSRCMFIASAVGAAIVVFFVLLLSSALSASFVFLCLQLTGMIGWCALCVHCMLLYPTGKRGTALGLLITITIVCGLLGLGVVAELPIKTSEVAQTIVTSLVLLAGGILMWTLPSVEDELIK